MDAAEVHGRGGRRGVVAVSSSPRTHLRGVGTRCLASRDGQESSTGGGLRNVSNPYLQQLIAESDLVVDTRRVQSGSGERYRFLSSLAPRLDQMELEVAGALEDIDSEITLLTDGETVDHEALRASYSRASAAVYSGRAGWCLV